MTSPLKTPGGETRSKIVGAQRTAIAFGLTIGLVSISLLFNCVASLSAQSSTSRAVAEDVQRLSGYAELTNGRTRDKVNALRRGEAVSEVEDAGTYHYVNGYNVNEILKVNGSHSQHFVNAEETAIRTSAAMTRTRDLTLTFSSDTDSVNVGQNLVYRIQYQNMGTAPVHNAYVQLLYDSSVTFVSSDSKPSSGTDNNWKIGTVAGGKVGEISVEVAVASFMQDQAYLVTDATISSDDTSDITAVAQTLINAPKLKLEKQAAPDPAFSGDQLVYTLKYSNIGHATASSVAITDALPANTDFANCGSSVCGYDKGIVTWDVGDLPVMASRAVTMVVNVHPDLNEYAQLFNTACVRVLETPDYSATAQTTTTVVNVLPLGLTITNGKDSIGAGEVLEYAVTFRNNSKRITQNTSIVATPPSSELVEDVDCVPSSDCQLESGKLVFDIGTLADGEGGTFRLDARVKDPLPAGARKLTASAVIDADLSDGAKISARTEDTDNVATRPDLLVTADYQNIMPWPGKRVTYTIHYDNRGHIASTGVAITANMRTDTTFRENASDPCWVPQDNGRYTCQLGELEYGESGDVSFVVILPSPTFTPDITDFDATMLIDDDGQSGEDSRPYNNTFLAPLGVPNLVVSQVAAERPIWSGAPGRLIATVLNKGSGQACGIYNPDGCTGFALDLFLDPAKPPPSYPIERFGDCYILVAPLKPGFHETVMITFTSDPASLYRPGYCAARTLEEIWFKTDNWDPAQPPYPAEFGLVPESDEGDNILGPFTPGDYTFLPTLIHTY